MTWQLYLIIMPLFYSIWRKIVVVDCNFFTELNFEDEDQKNKTIIDIYEKFNQVLFREKKKDFLEFFSSLLSLLLKGLIICGIYALPSAVNTAFSSNTNSSTTGTITYIPGTVATITEAIDGTTITRTSESSSTNTVPVEVTSYVNRLTSVRDTFSTAITNMQNTATTISDIITNYNTNIVNFFAMFPGKAYYKRSLSYSSVGRYHVCQ